MVRYKSAGDMKSTKVAYKAAILIASDRAFEGIREDQTGPALRKKLIELDYEVVSLTVVPDELIQIEKALGSWVDRGGISLILTSGGTGVSPRDLTPEATLSVIERRVPGIEEKMRFESSGTTANAILSRGVAGVAGKTMIINLPGSPNGALENLNIIAPVLTHALDLINGKKPDP